MLFKLLFLYKSIKLVLSNTKSLYLLLLKHGLHCIMDKLMSFQSFGLEIFHN